MRVIVGVAVLVHIVVLVVLLLHRLGHSEQLLPKAAAMKKLRKIEEEEDDVEPSDVARGKGKMRRLK